MKKRGMTILAAALAFNVLAASACGKQEEEVPKVPKIDYSVLYRNEEKKAPPVSGAALYKASYGYIDNETQGYNGFYYRARENGKDTDMTINNGVWTGNGASMEGGVMRSTASVSAVRCFVAPVSGDAHVFGNPRLEEGTKAKIRILLDDTLIEEAEIGDKTGIYHSRALALQKGQTLRFVCEGEAAVYWNPTVDYTGRGEESLHHAADGYYGDVHPFYDEKNNKLYMYYLSTGKQTENKKEQFASLLTTSGNFIRYEETPLSMDEKNPPEQELYYALGVYEDKDGNYRSSYGKGNYAGGSLSKDLLTWSNGAEPYVDESDGFLKYTYRVYFDKGVQSGRDPDIFYDKESGKYYCVVMNYYSDAVDKGSKGLALYTAGEDGRYSTKATKLLDCTGRGDPECPQLKKIGDRWYLFYSIYGTGTAGGVGRLSYRIGDAGKAPEEVDWNSKTEYALDGGDLHAAQLCKVGNMYYMYGWINYTPQANVWGGYLNLAREVYQKPDGRLASRCDEYLTDLLNMGRVAVFGEENTTRSGMKAEKGTFTAESADASAEMNGEFGRSLLFTHIDLPLDAEFAGVSVTEGNQDYRIGLTRTGGKLYLAVTNDGNDPLGGTWIELSGETGTSFDLKVVLDGNFIEAFVNDEYSLTANTFLTGGSYRIGLTASGGGAKISGAEICKLADLNNIFD